MKIGDYVQVLRHQPRAHRGARGAVTGIDFHWITVDFGGHRETLHEDRLAVIVKSEEANG